MNNFKIVDGEDKLNLLMAAINKINIYFHHKFEGLTYFHKNNTEISDKV